MSLVIIIVLYGVALGVVFGVQSTTTTLLDDVLEENHKLKEEIQWLNDVIKTNISDLAEQIASLKTEHSEDIASVRTDVEKSIEDIEVSMQKDGVINYVTKIYIFLTECCCFLSIS